MPKNLNHVNFAIKKLHFLILMNITKYAVVKQRNVLIVENMLKIMSKEIINKMGFARSLPNKKENKQRSKAKKN